jgi:translation elongation factor EF-Ts
MINSSEENKEAQEKLNALSPLAEKVASAIEKQKQETIDELSNINDSIKSANDSLINKIQEQINTERPEREA